MDLGDVHLPEVWQIDFSKPGGKIIKPLQDSPNQLFLHTTFGNFTYKLLVATIFKNRRLRDETEHDEPGVTVRSLHPLRAAARPHDAIARAVFLALLQKGARVT